MLYFLLYENLSPVVSGFRVFRYVTSRTAFASLTALFLCIALGPWLIGSANCASFRLANTFAKKDPNRTRKKPAPPLWAAC
jgi:phospho-N-acetylmuramoyl-pentapeptide-transferase